MKRVAAVVAVAALAGVAAPAAGGSASGIQFLRTPSGNIACALTWGAGLGPASLRCDILSGLKPLPPRPASCEFDWGAGYRLGRTGRARVSCVSDAVVDPRARVLRYGTTWRRLGFVCTSRRTGLRCVNPARHGFFLSRARSYRF